VALLGAKDVCVGPVNALDEAVRDPQVRHRGIIDRPEGAPVPYVRFPAQIEGVAPSGYRPAPGLGEDTEEILSSLGYGEAELDELAASGVIRQAAAQ
jgi:crotonobetainyl-CoA:carnitine CoA-transferase CaiB-like acyl-CoA transferase